MIEQELLGATTSPPHLNVRFGVAALLRCRTLLIAIRSETKSGELDAVPVLLRALCETFLAGTYCLVCGQDAARKLVRANWYEQERTTASVGLDEHDWNPQEWGLDDNESVPTRSDRLPVSDMPAAILAVADERGDHGMRQEVDTAYRFVYGIESRMHGHASALALRSFWVPLADGEGVAFLRQSAFLSNTDPGVRLDTARDMTWRLAWLAFPMVGLGLDSLVALVDPQQGGRALGGEPVQTDTE